MKLLIKNAHIAQIDGTTIEGGLLCDDGMIAKIESSIDAAADETIDAAGKLLMPDDILQLLRAKGVG